MYGVPMPLPATVPLSQLDSSHVQFLAQAFGHIPAKNAAEGLFSILVDGRQTFDTPIECRLLGMDDDFDETSKYPGPAKGSIAMFHSLREQVDPSYISVKASVRCTYERLTCVWRCYINRCHIIVRGEVPTIQPPCEAFKRRLLDWGDDILNDIFAIEKCGSSYDMQLVY